MRYILSVDVLKKKEDCLSLIASSYATVTERILAAHLGQTTEFTGIIELCPVLIATDQLAEELQRNYKTFLSVDDALEHYSEVKGAAKCKGFLSDYGKAVILNGEGIMRYSEYSNVFKADCPNEVEWLEYLEPMVSVLQAVKKDHGADCYIGYKSVVNYTDLYSA